MMVSNNSGPEPIKTHQKRSPGCGMSHLGGILFPCFVATLFVSLKIRNESHTWQRLPMLPTPGVEQRGDSQGQ